MFDFDSFKEKAATTANTAAAAAKRLAGAVKTNVTVYSEEERLKGVYQALGKQFYQSQTKGIDMEAETVADLCRQATEILQRIDSLRAQEDVSDRKTHKDTYTEATITNSDFADL